MKRKLLNCFLFATVWAVAPFAHAVVNLAFSDPGGGVPGVGIWASGFANAAGVPTDGMTWGIVVDTSGNGFAGSGATGYDAYSTSTVAGYLSFGGSLTDDYFIPSTAFAGSDPNYNITQDASAFAPDGGHGTILDTTGGGGGPGISVTSGNAAPGDQFSIIWFATNSMTSGSNYGMLTDASFILPNDTLPGDYSAYFLGADSAKPANLTFATAVPEPAISLLTLAGSMVLLFSRRRQNQPV